MCINYILKAYLTVACETDKELYICGLAMYYSNIFCLVVDKNRVDVVVDSCLLQYSPQKGCREKGRDKPSWQQGSSGWILMRQKGETNRFIRFSHWRRGFAAGGRGCLRLETSSCQSKQISACRLKCYPVWNQYLSFLSTILYGPQYS